MRVELKIDGKLLVIEAEGAVSVQVFEEKEAAGPVIMPEEAPGIVEESITEGDLFTKLAGLRRELAAASNVPPYVIFPDKTLREMAEKRPADLAAFANISGVGKAKLEKYGAAFLAVIEGVTV